jgi:AcrR family transcriptional regulator
MLRNILPPRSCHFAELSGSVKNSTVCDVPDPDLRSGTVVDEDEDGPRRGRPRASSRAAILEATLALLAERGFQATTMDAIAERAGVGKNSIYRRWASKDDLVADAIRELTAELDVQDGDDLYAQLLDRIRDFTHVFADPLLGRLLPGLLGELERNPAFAETYAERVVRPRYDAIVELLTRAVERGELRAGTDPELVADLLIGPPLLRLRFPFGLPQVPRRYAERVLETIWAGIAPAHRPSAQSDRSNE